MPYEHHAAETCLYSCHYAALCQLAARVGASACLMAGSSVVWPFGGGENAAIAAVNRGWHFGQKLCDTAQLPKGGWVEYRFVKPGKAAVLRKLGYLRSVEGTSYQVGSGIYDDTAKIEDLQKLSDATYTAAP